jgi:succinyl-CoA synthetase beta subunit
LIVLNLTEHEAKQVFSKFDISIPKGKLIADSKQVRSAVEDLKPPYMVKAQVTVGGRGKAGGILPAASAKEAEEAAAKLLGSQLKGLPIKQVLVEEKVDVKKELYVGFTVDRASRCYVALASAVGGIEIEETAEKTPAAIVRVAVDPQTGISSFDASDLAKRLGYMGSQLLDLSRLIQKLYRVLVESDAEMVEINPLVETEAGSFVAADARIVIDDNALFRHPEYAVEEEQTLTPQEALARKNNLAYVKLQGDVGVVGNGAGLVMATLDLLNLFGGRTADFLDVGGGASMEAIKVAVGIVLADPDTKAVLVNVLGGITRCDEVARGIIGAAGEAAVKKPLVVRLVGTNQLEGQEILAAAGMSVLDSMEEAAKRAVELAGGKR